MATIAAQVTDAGIIAPSYADILAQLKNLYWSIYGTDANLDADTQDGQFLSGLAQAIYDCNQTAVAVYNAFSPATAQGVGLSSVVKINGLTRQVPTNSQAVVTLVGQVGTTITGGIIGDSLGLNTRWDLPSSVTIPEGGQIDVTAISQQAGKITAAAGTLTEILTPTRGWQSVTNAEQAAPGNPVESDATLRRRQAQSTALGAETVDESIYAAIAASPGVTRLRLYDNFTDMEDVNGIPAHSICAVVQGGDVQTIAETIALKKPPGTGTYGDLSTLVIDSRGMPATIKYQQLSSVDLEMEITVSPKTGYTSAISEMIKAAVVAYTNQLEIGENSYLARLYGPAGLAGVGPGATFVVTQIRQARKGGVLAAADIVLAFDEVAALTLDDVTIITV